MTVELNPNYPSDLDETTPTNGDSKSEGDDNLRNLKRVLKNTLPNVTGAILPTHTVLNYLLGLVGNVQDQLDALSATSLATTLPGQMGHAGEVVGTDGTSASWGPISGYAGRTADTILSMAERGYIIDITSGTFTQTFTAAATLGGKWWCYIRNSGSGVVTLDPNGAETIDGLTSYAMYPGEVRLVSCDGSVLRTILLKGFKFAPTSTTTFIEPPGYRAYDVFIKPGGGGGGSGRRGATATARGGGGGGGGGTWAQARIPATTAGTSHTITIGAAGVGGAAVTTNDTNGNAGTAAGDCSFGTFLVAPGGKGGSAGTGSGGAGGASASAAAAHITLAGAGGGTGGDSAAAVAASDLSSWISAGGGGGGGISSSNAVASAAAGGASGTSSPTSQLAGGTAGTTAGTLPGGAGATSTMLRRGGSGGGGGAASITVAGGAGGVGGAGAGGGGGGASLNGQASGAGGNGGASYFEIEGIA